MTIGPNHRKHLERTVERARRRREQRRRLQTGISRGGGGGGLIPCRVVGMGNDHLLVRRWDGEIEEATPGESFRVAKPWKLRHRVDNYEGITSLTTNNSSEVEVSDGTDTEVWRVVPSYQESASDGDIIYVQPAKHTGVEHEGSELHYVDVNVDGRAWAAEIEED